MNILKFRIRQILKNKNLSKRWQLNCRLFFVYRINILGCIGFTCKNADGENRFLIKEQCMRYPRSITSALNVPLL